MHFAYAGDYSSPTLSRFAQQLRETLQDLGHHYHDRVTEDVTLVVNFTDAKRPRAFRRRSQAVFVVSVVEVDEEPEDVLKTAYPLLIRTLSNLLLYLVNHDDGWTTHFVTLEQGTYSIPERPADGRAYYSAVSSRLLPLATSTLVINNRFVPDLPPELWEGNETTREITWAGKKLDAMGLLPAPFPIEELLPERDFRHVRRLYGIGGLSYGNLSARHDARSFWMSASGVDKSNLRTIGRDILLVTGYDPEENAMILSVPPHVEPRRVSVDAIEHWMIYTEHPEVGAIVHIHGWIPGVPSTVINYPCGTYQLAKAVAEIVRQAEDPAQAVVGLRNHGLTITGRSLRDIFERIEGKVVRQVPMT